jgi:hypothetical protein
MMVVAFILCVAKALRSDPEKSIYGINFASKAYRWMAVLDDTARPTGANGAIVSKGPFCIDTNHTESGLLVGPIVASTSGLPNEPGLPGPLNLNGVTLTIRAKFDYKNWSNEYDITKNGEVAYWLQFSLPKSEIASATLGTELRFADYAYNQNLMKAALTGQTVRLFLDSNMNHWTCLGRNQTDMRTDKDASGYYIASASKYTCALNQKEFAEGLSHVDRGTGIIVRFPEKDTSGKKLEWLNSNPGTGGACPYRTPSLGNSTFTLSEFRFDRERPVNK